jgi:hypothetical protein
MKAELIRHVPEIPDSHGISAIPLLLEIGNLNLAGSLTRSTRFD